jgi:hypothetical protein
MICFSNILNKIKKVVMYYLFGNIQIIWKVDKTYMTILK